MNKVTITRALPEHAQQIKLRSCDLSEATAWLPGGSPKLLIEASIAGSQECFVGTLGGEVVAIGGYSVDNGRVTPWLVGSDLLDQHKKEMLRASRWLLGHIKSHYGGHLIYNYVAKENSKARLFLKALGFTILPSPGSGEFDFFYLPPCVSPQQP